jgi:signal transduction histidine kinase/ligand-binding sensor domain-containing protein/DNA-binding response OmpR family regulator
MLAFRLALFVFLLTIIVGTHAQVPQYQFSRLDMSNGLSHPMVNDIIKDSNGLMWFATSSGLNRFDGYAIKVYRNIPGDTSSLKVDDVTRIFEGPDGLLWLYSLSGNAIHDPRTETFYHTTAPFLKKLSIIEGLITSIKKDRDGNFWFIHFNMGLFRYDPATGKTTRLVHSDKDSTSIATQSMAVITEDNEGNIWLLHHNGIFEKLDKNSLKIVYRNTEMQQSFTDDTFDYKFTIDSDNDIWLCSDKTSGIFYFDQQNKKIRNFNTSTEVKLSSDIIRNITQDDHGNMWIGTGLDGINIIDKENFSVTYLRNDEEDDRTVSENSIQSMYKDNEGIIWIGTYKNGISFYHPNIFRFGLYRTQKSKPGGLPFGDVQSLAEDKKGNIWIGTDGGGLVSFNRKTNWFDQYLHDPKDPTSLSSNVVISLWPNDDNSLWIGTYFGGLDKFNGKRFSHYRHDPANAKSLGEDNVWEIYESSGGKLWLGTLKAGIDVFDPKKREFSHYKTGDINSIHSPYVPAIMEDTNGNMWFGTGYGLEVLDKASNRFIHYLHDIKNPRSISSNRINCVFQDSRGLIWIGTQSGLNLFDSVRHEFRAFGQDEGLRQNIILTLIEDDDHHLWMSTPNGLTKLMITPGSDMGYTFDFINYDKSDGLITGSYHENAVLKCANGELVFGGSNGFNVFHPRAIGIDTTKPKIVFTDFKIFNRTVQINASINDNIILEQAISYQQEITLKPSNNFFSIGFAALNYFHPEKSKYRYLMEGFHKDWITTDADHREATFTNLDPGAYSLKVQASNSDGQWTGETAVLKITVLPPFWRSNAAFLVYCILLIGALLLVRWIIVARERMNFSLEQQKVEVERMQALDEMKIKFFTNVSHEFLTPLTLIITPIERLLAKATNAEDKNHFKLIHRNAQRLMHLVSQLLDLRKIEVQKARLNASQDDIIVYIQELVYSFSDLSEKKHVQLTFRSAIPHLQMAFDHDKVEKIVFNLLSNAFKFTPQSGKVSVDLSCDAEEVFLKMDVTDTGIGIAPDSLNKIFERFFQDELPDSIVNPGSGIGLSITYEFVKMHGGFITVQSEPGKGSCFTVLLPIKHHDSDAVPTEHSLLSGDKEQNEAPEKETEAVNVNPVLLLVEDHEDFRVYLRDHFKKFYSVIEASNGREGLQKALATIPDLIVSDVMMPEMDGVELCRKLKAEPTTSHVPVILLTARNADEQKIEGFQSGADDYITKPFNFDVLQFRIKNLIERRQLFQKQFNKHLDVKASEVQITSLDEKFVKNAIQVVEDNLTNKNFSVEEMSRLLAVSRVLLYKKILSLTGKPPTDFIRTIRLQRAAQLLEKSQYSISEIAYEVGFNNPKYFSRYFRDQYHMLPSAYAAMKRGEKQAGPA